MNKNLKLGLIWYSISLILYGVLLYTFRRYDFLSTCYHLALLFPLLLVILKQEKLKDIGFRKGKLNLYAIVVVCFPIIIMMLTVFNNTINVIPSYVVFLSIVVSPITEEIFFRGFLQQKIFYVFWSEHIGKISNYLSIGVTAVLFGLIHIPRFTIGTYTIEGLLEAVLFGVLAGWIYSEGDTLAYPILFHALWNLSIVLRGG